MIYIINMRGTPHYKIGYTDMPVELRRNQLQTANPIYLDIIAVVEGDRALEAKLHRQWRTCRSKVNNEWFVLTNRQLVDLLRNELGVDANAIAVADSDLWPITTTFRQWLVQQAERDDIIGDFARDTENFERWHRDRRLPDDRAGHTTWWEFLRGNQVCEGAIEAFNEAWEEFGNIHARTAR